MKYFAVLLVVVGCFAAGFADEGLSEEQKAKLKQYKESCVAETGIDEAMIESVKMGEEVIPDEKLNCFSACMLKKVAIMKPDGSIDEEVARSKIPEDVSKEKVDEIVNTCKTQVGSTACETGGKVLSCLVKMGALPMFF